MMIVRSLLKAFGIQMRSPQVQPLSLHSRSTRSGYATDFELHRVSLGGGVVDRQVADDALPGAGEAEGQLLEDIQRSVGVHRKEHSEVADANFAIAVLRACIEPNREGERDCEKDCAANR